jgi:cell division protein FtsA
MANPNINKVVTETEKKTEITVGLDIGTSKVCALVASRDEAPNSLKILGLGIAESEGLNRGVVVNIEKTVKTIEKVIDQAQQQSGIKIEDVVVGIAGDHIQSLTTRGLVGISSPNHEITAQDVERVIDESRNIKLPSERKIIHVIPQDFIIDGQDGILDPIGMSGVRMEANVHIVTGLDTAIQNIYRCVEKLNLGVRDIILEPLASSYAVLDEEEKEVGVALVDIGGGTTDIAIFEENIIRFTSVFGIAGKQVTDDIRKGLGIIATQAERIKREYGHAHRNSIMQDEVFMIPGIGGRKPLETTKSFLSQIIQPRMEEIFEFALAEIRRSGFSGKLGAGVVITGGSALLKGTEELAQEIFGMPVKIGMPSSITYTGLAPEIKTPLYSTVVGLAMFGLKDPESNVAIDLETNKDSEKIKDNNGEKINIFSKLKKVLQQL